MNEGEEDHLLQKEEGYLLHTLSFGIHVCFVLFVIK
jgi:hypothetical protein